MFHAADLRRGALAVATLLTITLAGCDPAPAVAGSLDPEEAGVAHAHAPSKGSARQGGTTARAQNELARVRQATAHFHDLGRAQAAGYEVLVTHPETGAECLSHGTMGGMGYHYLNPDLVSADVTVELPQVILYEDGPNGEKHMVGVEYIIPFAIRDQTEPPPVLFGQEFVQNHTFDVWALHVWVWKHNPSGMFADYNPRVSCDA
jgi:hypothetical protein